MTIKSYLCIVSLVLPLTFVESLAAQERCEVVRIDEAGEKYQIDIAGERQTLFSEATLSQLARDYRESLDANEDLIKRCSSTIGANDDLLREYEAAMVKVRELSEELLQLSSAHSALNERFVSSLANHTALLEEYDALVSRYRRAAVRSSSGFDTRVGIGINNSDTTENWDLFLGVEVFQFDAWLYGNSDQQGLGLGLSF